MKTRATLFAFLAVTALAACSSQKTAGRTQTQSVTVETSEGTVAVNQGVDRSKLGAPVYPGAESKDSGSISSSGASGSSVIAAFKTSDPFEKVYDYYKQQLPTGSEKMKMSSGDNSIASFQTGDENGPDQVTVQVTSDKAGETDIVITHVSKTGSP